MAGTVLVTGANGGLGSAMVSKILATPGFRFYHGIYTVRNAGKATPALDAILQGGASSSKHTTEVHSYERLSLDLSNLASVRELASTINKRVAAGQLPPIRAIILNAACEEFQKQTWTEDGLDTTFIVNYLGHWLLVMMLLESMDRDRGRIVWLSSFSHNPYDPRSIFIRSHAEAKYKNIISDDLGPIAKGTWSPNPLQSNSQTWAPGYRRYGSSKLCGVTMINELQRRLDHDPLLNNIAVLAVDPGSMSTGIVRQSRSWFLRVVIFQFLIPLLGSLMVRLYPNGTWRTPDKSSRDVLAAGLNSGPPPLSERPKGLYLNGSEQGAYNPEAADPAKGIVVWKGSVKFAQLKEGDTLLQDWQ
ncbi:NAD(P)-binding protein [Nemania abortiva]|nr:NAD(P)-binding protein [Nemania abortiva]